MSMNPTNLVTTVAMAVLVGCASTGSGVVDPEIAALRTKQRIEERRLRRVRARVAASELEAQASKRRARAAACRAQVVEVQAAVAEQIASCRLEEAHHSECRATNSSRTAGGAALGCAAALIPGVGMLACLAGLAAGAASGDDCGETPMCEENIAKLIQQELRAKSLQEMPRCAELGARVTSRVVRHRGRTVVEVGSNSPAATAGVRVGDVLIEIQGIPNTDGDRFELGRDLARAAGETRLLIARDAQLLHLTAPAPRSIVGVAMPPNVVTVATEELEIPLCQRSCRLIAAA